MNNIPAPTYTNVLPLAITSSKTAYVGTNGEQGYKTNARLNSGGAESTATDWEVTGFIPITSSDVLYFKNVKWRGGSDKNDYIGIYNENFVTLTSTKILSDYVEGTIKGTSPETYGITLDSNGDVVSIDFNKLKNGGFGTVTNWSVVRYIRVSAYGITADSIITKNEPITD